MVTQRKQFAFNGVRRLCLDSLLILPGLLIVGSLIGAVILLARYSFYQWAPYTGMVPAWSLENYYTVATNPVVVRAFGVTLKISMLVTAVCVLIAYPAAYLISRSRHRNILVFLVFVPLLSDVLIKYYAWIIMLSRDGFVNYLFVSLGVWQEPKRLLYNEIAVVIGLVHEFIPLAVLPILTVLERINPSVQDAAMSLKAGPFRTFIYITLPLSAPGVIAASLLVFALTSSAFVAPLVLGGQTVQTLTMLMQQNMFTTLNWPLGSAESIVLVVAVTVIMVLYRQQLSSPIKHASK